MEIKKKRLLAVLALLGIVAVLTMIFIRIGGPLIELVGDTDKFKSWLESFGAWSYVVFVGIMILQVIVAVIPSGPFQVAGGYAFGSVMGTLLCIVGCGIGSMITFMFMRIFGHRFGKLFISEKNIEKLSFIERSPRWKSLLIGLFIIPGSPKDILNLFAGLTTINPWIWLAVSTLGRLPAIAASAMSGNAFGEGSYSKAVIIFGILLLVSAVGALVYKRIEDQNKKDKQ